MCYCANVTIFFWLTLVMPIIVKKWRISFVSQLVLNLSYKSLYFGHILLLIKILVVSGKSNVVGTSFFNSSFDLKLWRIYLIQKGDNSWVTFLNLRRGLISIFSISVSICINISQTLASNSSLLTEFGTPKISRLSCLDY